MSRKKSRDAQVKPAGMSKYALKLQFRRANCGGEPLPLHPEVNYAPRKKSAMMTEEKAAEVLQKIDDNRWR